jgi:hypothetical protein
MKKPDRGAILAMRGRTFIYCVVLFLLAVFLWAGGDPYGGRGFLWERYFETDPRLRELSETRDIPRGDRERCEEARELLQYPGGVEPVVEAPGGGQACPGNVIAVLDGSVPGAIIVSAHLDRAGSGEGAVDDFSGVVMLGMLYTYFHDRFHRHALVFVAFYGEEAGQAGSRRFIETSPHMPGAVTAVVNLECLGVRFPRSWEEGSSESLEEIFARAGKLNRVDSSPVSMRGVSADSVPFLTAGYPTITIQGIGPEDIRLLGTAWDRHSIVRGDIFDLTFWVLVEFISELDALSITPDPVNEIVP